MQIQDDTSRKNNARINRSLLTTILVVILTIGVSAGAGYYGGFQMGRKQGAKDAVKKVTDLLNPLNAISDSPVFPHTLMGKITAIDQNSITVKLPNGEEKKVILNDKTKYSKQDKVLAQKDVHKDSQVTVFTVGKDKEETATRVILRD